MLKLKNVSKYYYSNGVVTSGFSKVSLELKSGEFVAITGESGSGKSTLLNVISGLDTYEDGEMYIYGEETSAYSSSDFENYRRKYIGNIYQSFNLINSYTVYQNVDLVLRIAGVKWSERRKRVKDILEKVGLTKFRHTRASKLSGGQKQRVAIARALVKETPIIVADEPTGNLDSVSAANVIELLAQLASDRLVIVVTHNYDQVEKYVTRKLTMHDGRLIEDLEIKHVENEEKKTSSDELASIEGASSEIAVEPEVEKKETSSEEPVKHAFEKEDFKMLRRKHLKFFSRLRLGFRNTFNLIPKFLLLLFIFAFITAAVTGLYANLRSSDYNTSNEGYNYYFQNTSDKRIIIKKADRSPITEEDFEALAALSNVDYVYRDDVLLDSGVYLECSSPDYWYYFNGDIASLSVKGIKEEDLAYGRLPENDNELILGMSAGSYYNKEDLSAEIMAAEYYLNVNSTDYRSIDVRYKISGIYIDPDVNEWRSKIYCDDTVLEATKVLINRGYSTMEVSVAGNKYQCSSWDMSTNVIPSSRVPRGKAIVPSEWNYYWQDQWAPLHGFIVTVKNMYYTEDKWFNIHDIYYNWNFTEKTGLGDYNWNNGVVLINAEDFNEFYEKENYQSSVFIKDHTKAADTVAALKELGYEPLYVKDTLQNYDAVWMIFDSIYTVIWSTLLLIVLFFISYFIIKLIMKSRNVYYATVRMLGGTASDCKSLIRIELLVVLNIAFILVVGAIYASYLGYYSVPFVNTILEYLTLKDYGILYACLVVIALLISGRYARQLFKNSAMNVYKDKEA